MPDKIKRDQKGNCVLCMQLTDKGINTSKIFSSNFTDYEFLQAGDCICLPCAASFKTAKVRRSNWIVSYDHFQVLKWDKFIPAINDLLYDIHTGHDGLIPWSAFVTPNYKKHGWVSSNNAVNYSGDKFQIIFGKSLAHFTKASFNKIVQLVNDLIPVFGKNRTYNLSLSPYTLEVLYFHNLYEKYKEAIKYIGNPSWDLIVNCTPSVKKLLKPKKE